jgi:hypothetical protein
MPTWEHTCSFDGTFQKMPTPICERCGRTGRYSHSVIEMMARYVRLHGVPPIGPHRPLADRLFKYATGLCPECRGTEEVRESTGTVRECSACVMGEVVLKSESEMEVIRAQLREQFPEVFAKPEVDAVAESLLATVSNLDDQTLIDVLVFEAWRTNDETRSQVFGAQLTSRWDSGQGDGEDSGAWLPADEEILGSTWEPTDYLDALDGLSASRIEALQKGSEPTTDEVELCREIAVAEYFDNAQYSTWQVVGLQSRTGGVAYLAHLITGDYPCDCTFVGVYCSPAAAIDGLKRRGYVSLEDYLVRR